MSRALLMSIVLIAGCTTVPPSSQPVNVAAIVKDCDLSSSLRYPPVIQRLSNSKPEKSVICALVDGEIKCEQRDAFVVREIDTNEKIRHYNMAECIRLRLAP